MSNAHTSLAGRPVHPATLTRAALAGLALGSLLLPAAADTPADLQRCRALADDRARLACYDALAASLTVAPAVPAATAGAAAPAAPAAPMAAPAAAPPAAAEADFGRVVAPAGGISQVESRIAGRFEGWDRHTRFRLANGQVWQVVDGSQAVLMLNDPVVRVRRAALGSFLMEFEGSKRTVRVRRVE